MDSTCSWGFRRKGLFAALHLRDILLQEALRGLALRVRAEEDEDFMLFRVIDSEGDALPAGPERTQGSANALEREDGRITP